MNFEKQSVNIEQDYETEAEELENGLEIQEEELRKEVAQKKYGPLTKIARKFAFAGVMMLPAFAVGCGAVEKPVNQERPAAESKDGFTDNAHDNVNQRLKIKQEEIKRMHNNSRIIKDGRFEK